MLCPYRLKTVYEYAEISGKIFTSEVRTEFEKCYMDDCPLYSSFRGCVKANNEIYERDDD